METVAKVYFLSSVGFISGQTSRANYYTVMDTVTKVYFPSSLGFLPGQTSSAKCL